VENIKLIINIIGLEKKLMGTDQIWYQRAATGCGEKCMTDTGYWKKNGA
jgi:hypothetical protein